MRSLHDLETSAFKIQQKSQERIQRQQEAIRIKSKERAMRHLQDHKKKEKLHISLATNLLLLCLLLFLIIKTQRNWLYAILCLDVVSLALNSYFLIRIDASK